MSVDQNNVQDVTTSAQGVDGDGKLDSVDKMPENNQLAYETYKKALDGRHKFKAEAEELRKQVETLKQKELEATGKTEEQAKYWKEKALDYETKLEKTTAQYGWNQVKSQLSTELAKAGCVDPDVAISLIDKTELNSVEVNDDYSVNSEDLTRIVDSLKRDQRTQRIRLFGGTTQVNDMAPASKVDFQPSEDDVSKLSKDELIARMKQQ